MSRELDIQAEVGRRVREVIGRAHSGHALKVNSIHQSEEDELVEKLIETGGFTSDDIPGLKQLSTDALRSLLEKFAEQNMVGDEVYMNSNHDYEDFIHAHRPKKFRRELPEVRATRNLMGAISRQRRLTVYADDKIAEGMVPPSLKEVMLNRRAR